MRVQRPSNPRCNAEYNPQCNPPPTPRQRGCDTHPHTPMRCTALRRACTQPSGRPQSLGAALARTDVQPPFALRSGPNGGRCSKGGAGPLSGVRRFAEPASPSRGDFFPLRGNAPLRTTQAFEANAKSCAIAPHWRAHPARAEPCGNVQAAFAHCPPLRQSSLHPQPAVF